MSEHSRTAALLDPHPMWLTAVEQILAGVGIEVVGKATSPDEALRIIEEHEPELFVLELQTAGDDNDALECLRAATERFPGVKGVVLSTYDDAKHINDALAAGVVAYVVKTADPDDFTDAVRLSFESSIFLAGPRRRTAPSCGSETLDIAQALDVAPDLTTREIEILKLVAEGYSNPQLAKMLWVTEQTIKFHLTKTYRKLGVSNRTEASRWAQTHGLLATNEPVAPRNAAKMLRGVTF